MKEENFYRVYEMHKQNEARQFVSRHFDMSGDRKFFLKFLFN